ncbi:hypothetical protein KJ819_01275 [Patescibacteria group bacterium]|nr:hypothetical protein [Patescibacteria group bacterium]MBU1500574.1 hypothetical protein [Patescibacteria group bacterium]MBU2080457.1 hypothetical protein [Patescibacteria group bacterium]MBU2123738.1 hypothetical protein [Patescibacteria group bacterium]MBU2194594.1 hypothetical protein [Patescibacteria group bacterium]
MTTTLGGFPATDSDSQDLGEDPEIDDGAIDSMMSWNSDPGYDPDSIFW